MKKKSPICLTKLLFSDYSLSASINKDFISDIIFDKRRDFLIEKDFGGIAVKIRFENLHFSASKGVNRKISATVFDVTDRIPICTKQINIRIPRTCCDECFYIIFPASELEYKSGHAYRLQLRDEKADVLLGEQCFHLYGIEQLGNPENWFKPLIGGILPAGESYMLKSCNTDVSENKTYCVRFEVDRQISSRIDVIPELEIRIYYPNNQCVKVKFAEPLYAYRSNSTYIVEDKIHFSGGYCGIWYAELLCMEIPIAGFCFAIDDNIEGNWTGDNLAPVDEYDYAAICRRYNESLHNDDESEEMPTEEDFDALLDAFIAKETNEDNSTEFSDDSDDNLLAELDSLTGLRTVKEKITTYDKIMRFSMLRAAKGLELFHTPLHAMFLGSPGTGKTTVAKLMGKMLKKAGVLSSGHVVMKERSTLIGKYYNSEAESTLEAIEQAQGGILFIDEAHSLFQPNDPKDPGKFVIEALLTALADPDKDDWMLILAGYPDEMKRLFDLNPGFKSRIPESNIYTFDDFSEDELMEIAERRLNHLDFTLSPDARTALSRLLATEYAHRDEKFGNARHVMNLIHTEILPAMAVRVMEAGLTDRQSLSQIQPIDIPMSTPKATPRRKPVGFTFSSAS